MTKSIYTQALALVLLAGVNAAAQPAAGPLRVHPENPRYFTDDSGRAILLTGSHTWKSFLRGLNPIFMDPYDGAVLSHGHDDQRCDPIRQAMGYALDWSRRVDLAAMTPHGELASTKYCLANPGVEYLIYCPADGKTISVTLPAGRFAVLWFDASQGKETEESPVTHAGTERKLAVPIAGDALLHLRLVD